MTINTFIFSFNHGNIHDEISFKQKETSELERIWVHDSNLFLVREGFSFKIKKRLGRLYLFGYWALRSLQKDFREVSSLSLNWLQKKKSAETSKEAINPPDLPTLVLLFWKSSDTAHHRPKMSVLGFLPRSAFSSWWRRSLAWDLTRDSSLGTGAELPLKSFLKCSSHKICFHQNLLLLWFLYILEKNGHVFKTLKHWVWFNISTWFQGKSYIYNIVSESMAIRLIFQLQTW